MNTAQHLLLSWCSPGNAVPDHPLRRSPPFGCAADRVLIPALLIFLGTLGWAVWPLLA